MPGKADYYNISREELREYSVDTAQFIEPGQEIIFRIKLSFR